MASFCSHEPCVVIKGVSLQIQLTELKFPPKGVWAIPLQMKWGAQGRAATPSHWKEPPKCVGHLNRTPRGHYQGEAYFCFDCCRDNLKTVEVQHYSTLCFGVTHQSDLKRVARYQHWWHGITSVLQHQLPVITWLYVEVESTKYNCEHYISVSASNDNITKWALLA